MNYEKWEAPAASSATGPLVGFNKYEWNKFMFKVVTTGATSLLSVYVNNNLDTPDYTKTISSSMVLQKIAFCFYDNVGLVAGKMSCSLIGANIDWGSAYYKNIRVWDVKTVTTSVIQAFNHAENKL